MFRDPCDDVVPSQILYTPSRIPAKSLVITAGPMNGVFSAFQISILRESLATKDTADLAIPSPRQCDLTPPKNITAVAIVTMFKG